MNKIALKWKIYIVGLIPFLGFVILSLIYPVHQNYTSYKNASLLLSKIEVIKSASQFVASTQIERGKSAAFYAGGINLNALIEQRNKSDDLRKMLIDDIKKSSFNESFKTELMNKFKIIDETRPSVNNKSIPLSEVLKNYTSVIFSILEIELVLAEQSDFPELSAMFRTSRILEDARESGGKLRANLTAVIEKNQPIENSKFNQLIVLKGGVDEPLKSSGLELDDELKKMIKDFYNSQEWNKVQSVLSYVLKNSDYGQYGEDSKEFFKTITGALNKVGDMILYEKNKIQTSTESIVNQAEKSLWVMSGIVIGCFFALFFFISIMTKTITDGIQTVIDALRTRSSEVTESSTKLSMTSNELSESSTEQAASIQETVSSVDEISSMVQKNADAAKTSAENSEMSKQAAISGKEQVNNMLKSIEEISYGNSQIVEEVNNNNQKISSIVDLMNKIEEKTKVINDIVFQTKLLSFNASVEAARAGEHGKGFAVVAEEVGNLAAMSGKAALEISEMLDSSVKQVKDIINQSQDKIDDIIMIGKDKIDRGTEVANKCSESLDKILESVSLVNDMVSEISNASQEQASGITEITKSMQQLDQVTHSNAALGQQSAGMSNNLLVSAEKLDHAVNDLTLIIEGQRHNVSTVSSSNVLTMNSHKPTNAQVSSPSLKKVSGESTSYHQPSDSDFEDL